jgi:hypothetical protein
MQSVSKQQISKHTYAAVGFMLKMVFSVWAVQSDNEESSWGNPVR